MGKKGYTGGVHICKPVKAEAPCTGSRNGLGEPKCVQKACQFCGEWRCKSHCKCARQKRLAGRNCGRDGAGSGASSGSASAPASASTKKRVVLPVAEENEPEQDIHTLKHLDGASALASIAKDLRHATAVEMCQYTFDDTELRNALLEFVRQEDKTLRICVDRQYLQENPRCHHILQSLAEVDGCDVYTARGDGRYGSMHLKITVIYCGRKVICYHGTANATRMSRSNWESVLRLTGSGNTRDIVKLVKQCCLPTFRVLH